MKKTLWITYAWADNETSDIDFYAQELEQAGLNVKLDRWNINGGHRVWPQIADFIQNPNQSDAWMIVGTTSSLGSEACKEELAYALGRALQNKDGDFPVMALFSGPMDKSALPAALSTRLYFSVTDSDWKERVVAAVEGRLLNVNRPTIEPFEVKIHEVEKGHRTVVEVRPRAGVWNPFICAIPVGEADAVGLSLHLGPRGQPGDTEGLKFNYKTGNNSEYYFEYVASEVTPTKSAFVFCSLLPSMLIFGAKEGDKYTVEFNPNKF